MKLQALNAEKPWTKLHMTRRQYETARPWENSGMNRQKWEEVVLLFPDDTIEGIYREAEADRLIEAIFGSNSHGFS